MKLNLSLKRFAFTLPEMSVALAASGVVLAATLTSSTSLQKSFNAVDNYFGTHMQQVRIVDYLSRDVKRGLAVTTSADLQTVTITVPNYVVQAGDPEAVANPALVGTPRTPTMAYTPSGWQVNYGAATSTIVYSINGMSILRTENGTVTTIASSTDQLVPLTTDVELSNTEYTKTSITFQPIFTSGGAVASRSGTTVYSTAYLRNKRRG
jgi:prepilin-type N-terminal cleavage/methylation domain-containing protein